MKKIFEEGLVMYDNGQITIDTNLWTTQALLTKKLKLKRNRISEKVRRGIKNGTLTTYYIEQLGIRLIPNVNSISELRDKVKKQ